MPASSTPCGTAKEGPPRLLLSEKVCALLPPALTRGCVETGSQEVDLCGFPVASLPDLNDGMATGCWSLLGQAFVPQNLSASEAFPLALVQEVRMAEWSKALRSGRSPLLWAWVRIPLLTDRF